MDIFLARQPIFDKELRVQAYELLFRSSLENFYQHFNGDEATSTVLDHSFFGVGLEEVTRGKRAFVNFTRNLLVKEFATLFSKDMLVVEILEDIEPDREIVGKCQRLKELGYSIALDDFTMRPGFEFVLPYVDIVKIDFVSTRGVERRLVIDDLRTATSNILFLAEKVETQEDFDEARKIGYTYFQGYFFERPNIISKKAVSAYKMNYLRILQEINRPELNLNRLEAIFKQDVTLSYKLMTYINSAYFGFPNEIRSIRHALSLLGPKEARKWLSLMALSSIGKDKSEELVVSSLFRANLCELLAPLVGMKEYGADLFLVGLFSMIDAFLDQPLETILESLPISKRIKTTLLGEDTEFSNIYKLVLAYEKGAWDTAFSYLSMFETKVENLPELFIRTVERSNSLVPIA
jgi:EAL and modified HD-GYP domain-containing signal transduction protein